MKLSVLFFTALICLYGRSVSAVAVMSVDLGTEWMKIAIVSPGVPMEIVLNKESKRKTPAVVAYRDDVRTFGEDAQNIGVRFPKSSYGYLLDLLGKDINNPIVKLYQERFPYYNIVEDPERGTILFKLDEKLFYSPEELLAQLLQKAKEYAEQSALQPVNEMVLTVPGFFNQAERKALLQAAELAGIKVLQLINDYTAVALNYGIFRRKDFNDSAQYVMFYDMGATKTTATIVSYQNTKTKERGYLETNPTLAILGVGYDRTLGGLEITLRLRDHLAKRFDEVKKTSGSVFDSPRSLAKLFKEAGRVKTVLSANPEHAAQVEGLLNDEDMRLPVTREELEELIPDLLERVAGPVHQALKTASLTMDVISQVILVGAGTRVPKVQEKLQEVVGMELSKNINADEAAAMGAVYKGADLSTGFKVKKFITKDAALYPIQVVFERDGKQVKRTLFSLMNPYPQKKIITFNKHTEDFSFNVNYADLGHLTVEEIKRLGSLNLSRVEVKGVSAALAKHNTQPGVDSKGIKAHFSLDESGVLQLASTEATFEKTVTESEPDNESPLSKLGSTISKLFTSGDPTPAPENITETAENDQKENITSTNNTATNATKEAKPKVVIVKEPITTEEETLSLKFMSQDQFIKSFDKLAALNEEDRQRTRRETALNQLETLVIDARLKLTTDDFKASATPEERENIEKVCDEISNWLYEDGSDADTESYEKKIEQMQELTDQWYARVWEHNERPEALKALHQMLNGSSVFLENAKNLTKAKNPEKDIFTDIEIETLSKVITETTDWRDKIILEQKKLKKYNNAVLTVKMLSEKMAALDREVKYLVNKLKIWRPKHVEKPVKEPKETKNSSDKSDKIEKEESKPEKDEKKDDLKEKVEAPVEDVDTEDEHLEL